jgi:hypothetical protein
MFSDPYDQHSLHIRCAVPSCSYFHLFCPTCGERHHVSDVADTHGRTLADTPEPTVARTIRPLPVSATSLPAAAKTA